MIDAPTLTLEIAITLAIGLGALALFVWPRVRIDVVAILVMVAVILAGLVTPQEGISGFANEATITVAAMFVLSAGLVRTGAVEILGRWLGRVAGESEFRLLVVSLAIVIPISAFINNTPVVVVMVPLIMGLTRDTGIAPSKLFLPISYASQMGGSMTLIGTSTNLLVAGLVLELGMDRIGLFDMTIPGFLMMLVGVAYLLTIGRWLTPVRETDQGIEDRYELGEYLSGLRVEPASEIAGKTLREVDFGKEFGLLVVTIERKGERIDSPRGGQEIQVGDILVVKGKMGDITAAADAEGLRIAGTKPRFFKEGEEVEEAPVHLAELMVPLRSPVVGRSIRGISFRGRYGLPVLGIRRHGEPLHEPMRSVRLEAGDILLVQGSSEELRRIHKGGELALLGAVDLPVKRPGKLRFSFPIIAGVVLLAAFNITPILVSALMGAAAMFLTGCLTPDEAYQDVDWMVLVLLGGMIPLGVAMQGTGTAMYLVAHFLRFAEPLGLLGTLGAFYLVTTLLTAVISNNAAAVVLAPIAVATGMALEVSALPFVMAVMFGASTSYMTPIGYQTNTFIFGPGGYRFSDYLRVGAPLNLIMLVVATLVIPVFFPF